MQLYGGIVGVSKSAVVHDDICLCPALVFPGLLHSRNIWIVKVFTTTLMKYVLIEWSIFNKVTLVLKIILVEHSFLIIGWNDIEYREVGFWGNCLH